MTPRFLNHELGRGGKQGFSIYLEYEWLLQSKPTKKTCMKNISLWRWFYIVIFLMKHSIFCFVFFLWKKGRPLINGIKDQKIKISAQPAVYYGREFCLGAGEQGSGWEDLDLVLFQCQATTVKLIFDFHYVYMWVFFIKGSCSTWQCCVS